MSDDDVIARFIRGEIPKRDRRRDGVTTRTNYSGANTRGLTRGARRSRACSECGCVCPVCVSEHRPADLKLKHAAYCKAVTG